MSGLCEICSKQTSKYRCPTCKTSTCSLDCTKLHKAQCVKPLESMEPQEPEVEVLPGFVGSKAPASTSMIGRDAFKDLADSQELKDLFTRYPGLQKQLDDVYQAATDPSILQQSRQQRGRHPRGRGGRSNPSRQAHWTPEQGFENALQILENAELSGSTEHEGIREFSKLVLQLCPPAPTT